MKPLRFIYSAMQKRLLGPLIITVMVMLNLLGGCETSTELTQIPARLVYVEAESVENQGLYSEAITQYEKLIKENPGTRLATFSYLRIAELQAKLEKWKEAETNYRAFLALQPKSHLTPFLLYRLLQINHERSYTGLLFREREIDRDMAPNRNIILEYKRFLLLYPHNPYLEEVTPVYQEALATLAESELMVGNFYFKKEQYNAAIGRYQYLLRNYPAYPKVRMVLQNLIKAYERNNQPDLAREMRHIETLRFGDSSGVENDTTEKSARNLLNSPTLPISKPGNDAS